jgi:hypothetical protein
LFTEDTILLESSFEISNVGIDRISVEKKKSKPKHKLP